MKSKRDRFEEGYVFRDSTMNKTIFMTTICLMLIGVGIHFESSHVLFVAIGFGLGNLIMGIMNFFKEKS